MASPLLSAKSRVENAISQLDCFKDLISSYTSEWKNLHAFISEIDRSLLLRLEELKAKEKSFEESTLAASRALDKREEAIPIRENALIARIQQQQDASLAKFHLKRKLGSANMISSDGTDMEVADSAIAYSEGAHDDLDLKEKPNQVRARPEIVSLCENMDGEGLRNFIVDHRREFANLRHEVTVALRSSIDPCRLVLESLEGYHVLELDFYYAKETGASANRRACILLLECLAEVLSDPAISGGEQPVVPPNIKKAAKEVAELWKSKRDAAMLSDGGNENSLDAQAFLQLLATFGISSEYKDDELLKLVHAICRRKQTPALCEALGLKEKMPGFIESLCRDGKQIEAICFANYFGLMDKIQPGAMLKAYLKEARKPAVETSKSGTNPKHETVMKELSAVKAVLKAVEEYKLSDQFSTDGLRKRLTQLERSKADRRKASVSGRNQAVHKKPRLGGGASQGTGIPQTISGDRSQYAAATLGTVYERRPQAGYSSVYGSGSRSPGSLSNTYVYSADMVSASPYQPTNSTYSTLSAGGYSTYPYGSGLPTQTSYPSSYLR